MTKLSSTIFGATLTLALAAAFADAQTTPKDTPQPQGKMGCMMGEQADASRSLAELANIKVENTKLGATIQLTAKNAADADKVQELARNLATELAKHPDHSRHGH